MCVLIDTVYHYSVDKPDNRPAFQQIECNQSRFTLLFQDTRSSVLISAWISQLDSSLIQKEL
jgi:hypothetical protein